MEGAGILQRPKDVLNPRDFEEFADANAMQKEMFLWAAADVINKSTDLKFLNRCCSLAVRADHHNWMLGHALTSLANKRLTELSLKRWRRILCRLFGHDWYQLAAVVEPDEFNKPCLHRVSACTRCFEFVHAYTPSGDEEWS